MDDTARWFLTKQEDGSVFGPLPFSKLHHWAVDACISPLDKVSSDGQNWVKAPMIPELHMDYLVELEGGALYGPTTIGALREFHRNGELRPGALLTNCRNGERMTLQQFTQRYHAMTPARLPQTPPAAEAAEPVSAAAKPDPHPPERIHAKPNLQARLHELEELLLHERQQRQAQEAQLARARQRIAQLESCLGIQGEAV